MSSSSSPKTPLLKKHSRQTSSFSLSCNKDELKELKHLKTELQNLDQRLDNIADDLSCKNDLHFDNENTLNTLDTYLYDSVEDVNFDDINNDNNRTLNKIRLNIEKIERDMNDIYKEKKSK